MRDVALVDLTPAQYMKAISEGEVDAVIAWEPHIHRINQKIGGLTIWPAQSSQAVFGVLVCTSPWLQEHKDTATRFLKSLKEAEEYLLRYPDRVKAIVQKRLEYDDSYVRRIWPQHQFSLSLDQTLVVAMKDEAQWMIRHHLTSEEYIPELVNYIYTDGLHTIKPYAVNIIR